MEERPPLEPELRWRGGIADVLDGADPSELRAEDRADERRGGIAEVLAEEAPDEAAELRRLGMAAWVGFAASVGTPACDAISWSASTTVLSDWIFSSYSVIFC
jgi:hypothetical protein